MRGTAAFLTRRVARVWLAGLIGVALGLSACGDADRLGRLAAGEQGRVIAVQSGDVLVLDTGFVVRLAQVEAPFPDQLGGPEARADLQGLVGGQRVQLFYGGARRDPHGRALAQVRRMRDGLWIQSALLADGWARVRTYADNRALVRPLLDDEAKARLARRGLWSMDLYDVRLPTEIGPRQRGFQIVEGRVAAVDQGRETTFLEFTPGHHGFAVMIPRGALARFTSTGPRPAALLGRLIRVRGQVGWDSLMLIDHPEQIERLSGG